MTGTLHEGQHTIFIILALFLLQLEMFQANVVKELKTHLLPAVTPPRKIVLFMR